MIGHLDKSAFKPKENYDEFYRGHRFEPLPEPQCYLADMVIPRVGWAVDTAMAISAASVLDLCCLDGFALLSLATRLDHLIGTGVDLSEPGVTIAQQRADKRRLKLRFIEAPVEGYRDELKYDLVLLFEAIEHFKDPDAVMETIRANMNPGATLLVSTPDADGRYGIANVEDVCHLQVYSHRLSSDLPEYPDSSPVKKPVISLPDYLNSQGFQVEQTAVWSDLVHCKAVLR